MQDHLQSPNSFERKVIKIFKAGMLREVPGCNWGKLYLAKAILDAVDKTA
ncbi:MAG TPA: hypothetical protein VFX47_05570 [Gammaproteobacteria bacterium]|nr:hypothetical protein [Gammaproteobacteria bacterium]